MARRTPAQLIYIYIYIIFPPAARPLVASSRTSRAARTRTPACAAATAAGTARARSNFTTRSEPAKTKFQKKFFKNKIKEVKKKCSSPEMRRSAGRVRRDSENFGLKN